MLTSKSSKLLLLISALRVPIIVMHDPRGSIGKIAVEFSAVNAVQCDRNIIVQIRMRVCLHRRDAMWLWRFGLEHIAIFPRSLLRAILIKIKLNVNIYDRWGQ